MTGALTFGWGDGSYAKLSQVTASPQREKAELYHLKRFCDLSTGYWPIIKWTLLKTSQWILNCCCGAKGDTFMQPPSQKQTLKKTCPEPKEHAAPVTLNQLVPSIKNRAKSHLLSPKQQAQRREGSSNSVCLKCMSQTYPPRWVYKWRLKDNPDQIIFCTYPLESY